MRYPAWLALLLMFVPWRAAAQGGGEDRRFLEDTLENHRARIDRLTGEHEAASKRFVELAGKLRASWSEQGWTTFLQSVRERGRDFNEETRAELRRRGAVAAGSASRAAAAARAAAIEACRHFRDASAKLAGCSSATEADAIDALVAAALQRVAEMERVQIQAHTEAATLPVLTAEHERLTEVMAALRADYIRDWQRQIAQIGSLEALLPELAAALTAVRELELRLRSQHAESAGQRSYFLAAFPESRSRWDALLKRIPRDVGDELAGQLKSLSVLVEKCRRDYEAALSSAGMPTERPWTPPQVQPPLEAVEAEVNAARLEFMSLSRLRRAAAECRQRAADQSLELLGARPDGSAPAARAGGLKVLGQAELSPGQLVRFRAVDDAGSPYVTGVEWNSSVEDVVVIDRSTGSATGFKPGSSVIIAKVEGMTAFLAVRVTAPAAEEQEPPAAGGGFADLGGTVREVRAAENTPPPSNLNEPGRLAAEEAASNQAALDLARQAEAEAARVNELRRQRDAAREQAAGQLFGGIAGMNQTVEDLRNRDNRSNSGPPPHPPPAAGIPESHRRQIDRMGALHGGWGSAPPAPASSANPSSGGSGSPAGSRAQQSALLHQRLDAMYKEWYRLWCPRTIFGCSELINDWRNGIRFQITNAVSDQLLDRAARRLPCYDSCARNYARDSKPATACFDGCTRSIR